MRYETLDIKNSDSGDYAALHLYLLDPSPEISVGSRPMVIVCPGGGYSMTSDREAEMIAVQYIAMGYHAAVLRYSVAPAVFPTALLELGRAVALIREHAQEYCVDPEKIVVSGFSAGGHLAASYCVFWNQSVVTEGLGTDPQGLRPNGLILGYPVITSGEYAHHDSFKKLLGEDYETKRREVSLEYCVGEQVPRTFIWHTYADNAVPVQNSLLFVSALAAHHIPTEFHMFETGEHGLALANRLTQGHGGNSINPAAAAWVGLVHQWMESWILKES